MSLCVTIGGTVISALMTTGFSLSWEHSVEHTLWREAWVLTDAGLVLTQARVKGSGAGMDPGEGARLVDGWWVWEPELAPQPELTLASSGATGTGWTLCANGDCRMLGAAAGRAITLSPCPDDPN